jgi:hypothetical protein
VDQDRLGGIVEGGAHRSPTGRRRGGSRCGGALARSWGAVLSGWLAVAVGAGEQAQQVEADLVPHGAGEGWAAPGDPAAGAAAARCGGLVLGQDPSQCVDGAGVVTGSLQLGEIGPGRGAGVATGPFRGVLSRTRCADLSAPGSPRVLPVGQPLVAVAGVGVQGVGMVLPR